MSVLQSIIRGLEAESPELAAALRAETQGTPAEPPKPKTLLDDLRDDAIELGVQELPNVHELPQLVGALVGRLHELEANVESFIAGDGPASAPAAVEQPAPPSAPPTSEPGAVSSSTGPVPDTPAPGQPATNQPPAPAQPPAPITFPGEPPLTPPAAPEVQQ